MVGCGGCWSGVAVGVFLVWAGLLCSWPLPTSWFSPCLYGYIFSFLCAWFVFNFVWVSGGAVFLVCVYFHAVWLVSCSKFSVNCYSSVFSA